MSRRHTSADCWVTPFAQKQQKNAEYIPTNVPAFQPTMATSKAEPAVQPPTTSSTRQPVVAASAGIAPPSAPAVKKPAAPTKRVNWGIIGMGPSGSKAPSPVAGAASSTVDDARKLIGPWFNKSPPSTRPSSPATASTPTSPTSTLSAKEYPPLAAPLHPGHPQKAPIATDEEYRAKRAEEAKRNAANRATAQRLKDEIAAKQNGTYKQAAQQPAWHRLTAHERMARDLTTVISREQELTNRVKALEAGFTSLKAMFTPSRSAPVETIRSPVREITPPLDQPVPAAVRQTPGRPAAAPSNPPAPEAPAPGTAPPTDQPPASEPAVQPPTGTPTEPALRPFIGPQTKPRPSRRERGRALAKTRSSSHSMATRAKAQQQGGPTVVATTLPDWRLHNVGVPFQQAKEAQAAKRRPKAAIADGVVAAAVGVLAATVVPTASASSTQPGATNFSLYEDSGVLWTQVLLAAAIWALFVVGRHSTRRSRALTRMVKVATLFSAAAWTSQALGAWTPAALLWQSAGALGVAAPIFWAAALSAVVLAVCWRHAERRLFQKALKL